MAKKTRLAFVHREAVAGIEGDVRGVTVSIISATSVEKTEDDKAPFVAESLSLRGHLGVGDSEEGALESLIGVIEKYLQLYVEYNGVPALSQHLVEQGFHLVPEAVAPRPMIADEARFVKANLPPAFLTASA